MKTETRGLLLGLAGIIIFSLTLPATKVAVVEMTPNFIAFGRALLAGMLAIAVLILRKASLPNRSQWLWLAAISLGVVFGFPYFSTQALRGMSASHGAVIVGMMPLATAVFAVLVNRESPKPMFWFWALLGSAIVLGFSLITSVSGFSANFSMLAAVIFGAMGYACGARLSASLGGINTICWALVMSLPFTAVSVGLTDWPTVQTSSAAWIAFAYVSVFSMFIGFFFWYNGLAMGGVARVGQIQLLQPFFTLGFAALINREALQPSTFLVGMCVVFVVLMGRKNAKSSQPPSPHNSAVNG